jgi:hypothetical protein
MNAFRPPDLPPGTSPKQPTAKGPSEGEAGEKPTRGGQQPPREARAESRGVSDKRDAQ